ncbi:hypothetical protein ACFPYJ_28110 [Paenibacillus solisilvae]|uniref:Uncharacterized protein n=1 Tax=Paenibacillus solisilvae TaxID=2486751 RepID=A0ABW0W879_9BACL
MKTNDQVKEDEQSIVPLQLDVYKIMEQLGIDCANLPQDILPFNKK